MIDFTRLSVIRKNGPRHFRDPVTKVDFFEEQTSPVGSNITALEVSDDVQIQYASKIELFMTHCKKRGLHDNLLLCNDYSILSQASLLL